MRNQMKRLLTTIRVGHWTRLAGPVIGACVLAIFLATNVGADTTPITYYACINTNTGSIYMTTATGTCRTTYSLISWNQVGPQGPQGPAGPTGPQGPQGPQGPAGPTQTLTIIQPLGAGLVFPGNDDSIEADCPPGTLAVGGGFDISSPSAVVIRSEPKNNPPTAWLVEVFNPGSQTVSVGVFAVCASLA